MMSARSVSTVRSRSRGLTLTETVLAIAVGAVVLVGGVMMYMGAVGNNQLNDANTQLQATVSGVRQLYAGQSTYASLTNAVAIAGRIFPAAMVDGGSVRNPWKGDVTVTGAASSFTVQFARVPQDSCAKLISMNTSGMGGAVQGITVNGSTVALPIDPAAATAACNATEEPHNTIAWTVR